MLNRRHLLAASATGLLAGLAPRALAQAVKKPVHVIVGFPAGGGTDVTARVLAEALRGAYASTVLVENKPGASARIAVEYVKNAEPDGSVMLFTPDFPMTLYPHSFKSLSYDPLKDFTPVGPATTSMLSYNVGPAVPASVKIARRLCAVVQGQPGQGLATGPPRPAPRRISPASCFRTKSKVTLNPVHYRGGAPALQDVVGGHIPMSVNPLSEALPLHQGGTIRALAVTGAKRSQFMPNVPTAKESGYDVVVESWLGVFLPAEGAGRRGARAEQRDEAGIGILDDEGQPRQVRQHRDVPDAGAIHRDDQGDINRWGPVVKASGFVAVD